MDRRARLLTKMDMSGRLKHHPIEQVIGPVDRFFVDRHEFVDWLLVTGAEKGSPDLVGIGVLPEQKLHRELEFIGRVYELAVQAEVATTGGNAKLIGA